MVQQSTLAGLVVVLGSVPSTYTVCNCSSRRSKILLFWPPQTPGTLVYSHTCKAKHSYTWDKIKHEIYSWCGNYKVRLYLREKTMKNTKYCGPMRWLQPLMRVQLNPFLDSSALETALLLLSKATLLKTLFLVCFFPVFIFFPLRTESWVAYNGLKLGM